jgi:pyridoxamine 5'-phosphate oxidase family protein
MFTEKERAYLTAQRLARLATIDASGQPDADVVGFELDGEAIVIGSYRDLANSRKYQNVAAGNTKVSLIVDSLASVDPLEPMAVKIHGTAAIERRQGRFGPEEYLVIGPHTSWSWGIQGPTFVDGQFQPCKAAWSS